MTATDGRIDRFGERAGLSASVRSLASHIYTESKCGGGTGPEGDVAALAALSLAADVYVQPIELDDLISAIDWSLEAADEVTPEAVAAIKQQLAAQTGVDTLPDTAYEYVDSYCEQLGVPETTYEIAKIIIQRTDAEGSGKAPTTIAAAAIYAASLVTGQDVTQAEITDVTGVAAHNFRPLYRQFYDQAHDLPENPLDSTV